MSTALSFQVTGVNEAMAEVGRRHQRWGEDVRSLFDQYGIRTMELTSELSPYDTGFMSSKATYTPLDPGDAVGFTVGWHEEDFRAAGLEFYPVFQEFGTIFHPAQPSLGPAGRQLLPELRRDAAATLRQTFGG